MMIFSKQFIAFSAALVAVAGANNNQAYPPNVTLSNSTTSMYQLSSDAEFAFILEEYLSLANEEGAATGEILRAAALIEPGNIESWYKEFKFLGDKIGAQAKEAESNRLWVSAREAYFRSSSYYRAADFFLHGNQSDPRIYTLWDKQSEAFNKAVKLLPEPPAFVQLKATNFTVPAYFYPAAPEFPPDKKATQGKRLPTILVGTGYDGNQESLYHGTCREVIARGWNCITYEGPGQPTVRRQQNIGFIPEWWEVVTPIVDYVRQRKDVDPDRVALIGLSFGGLLAPLAATREHRLAAVVAIDGLLNLQRSILEKFPTQMVELFTSGNKTGFNEYVEKLLAIPNIPLQFKWGVDQGTWAWNTTDPYTWLSGVGEFNLDQKKLSQIQCPVFVASGQDDHIAPGQPEEMARLLGEKSNYFLFETELGAGEHCAIGAEQQLGFKTLGWLDEVFAKVKTTA